MKDPYFAGFLNLIPGLGYLYLGVRRVFAVILLASTLFMVLDWFLDPNAAMYEGIPVTLWSNLAWFLMTVAFIVDGYLEGKKLQQKTKTKKK